MTFFFLAAPERNFFDHNNIDNAKPQTSTSTSNLQRQLHPSATRADDRSQSQRQADSQPASQPARADHKLNGSRRAYSTRGPSFAKANKPTPSRKKAKKKGKKKEEKPREDASILSFSSTGIHRSITVASRALLPLLSLLAVPLLCPFG
ncbi:hypothetical protein TRV_03929 [Trichophyton verrucosum HKI 0517]|uniref:Uncharacterized protein n=1 Tax=Trichophyton verrucosum (strain HKI 0517) TaxID=663202 RepID=D4D9Y6_TRIVH|nr:uncharacterized protein TRV_03929 [Trichophyton verrucosum HKI 0517]EFE41325.1 hypothetical protein TRV_03929 [Trichophyton verrucosum HKI 0517]